VIEHIERSSVYAIVGLVGLVGLRLIWGFIGPRHARFVNFVRSPAATVEFLY